ncbi:hypothetical protein K443DRAFT_683294 [Laccaria amethystina LaAM-08-1]|uniref:Septation protein imp2 n=1 Tax=Laccaria amethystina LaAM-08-1 TaxID=1095629 RepID=A0A0C9WT95_9AGAR|nr:hypothetical protein K443DRAFT_683294 [Laccaria amethystina LaAM-08-1]
MSARRQPSTTSLSKYVRASTPDSQPRSLDFCNAFWGLGDGGVDVLFTRMRGASRTVEELKNFWKERASIEEEYAKRLTKLSKMVLGRDEIGELRSSLNAVKFETERQSGFHLNLAQQIRSDLESPAAAFHTRQLQHKKVVQGAIEKDFKTKQTQETYVNKAREKYEGDCMRINSFTAQSSLVQGKDLEKINIKLERAQQTVQINERDFANFSKALQDTVHKWEQAWKVFCDQCQDLEEERMEFMRDNMWAYANCVSTVCVADDESCEKMRLALERMEAEKDMENFVRDYGTGNQIPDPPTFVNYNTPDAVPSSSSRTSSRPAQFVRATQRELPLRNIAEPDSEEPVVNTAGIGAGGGRRSELYTEPPPDLIRRPTQSRAQAQQAVYVNGVSNNLPAYGVGPPAPGPTGQPPQRRPTNTSQAPSQTSQRILHDPHAETIDPTAETYIKVGNNAYKVDLSKDPQQGRTKVPSPSIRSNASSPVKPIGNGSAAVDPLAKQLEELQNAVSSTGSVRRNTLNRPSMAAQAQEQRPSSRPRTSPGPSALSPPPASTSLVGSSNSQSTSPAPVRDYGNSAEAVVGTHPAAAVAASRPASPNPPTAAFMVPRPATPSGSEVVQEVLADYHQSLPGERKSLSRQGSRRGSFSTQPGQQNPSGLPQHQSNFSQGQNLARPPSTGHAGIGAHGSRSNSPQPQSRGPSPAPGSVVKTSYITPPPQGVVRAPSPNAVGIVLDPSGRVLHDDMAHGYQQQHQHRPQQQQQRPGPPQQQQIQPQYNPPIVPQQQQQQPRRSSYMSVPPPQQQAYAVTPPPPTLYQAPPPQASYIQPPPVQPTYTPSPVLYQPVPAAQQQQQPTYQMTPAQAGPYSGVNGVGVGRGAPGYYQPQQPQLAPVQQQQQRQLQPQQQQLQPQQRLQQPQQQQLQPQQQQRQGGYQPQQQQLGYQDPGPVGRSPSPQPPPPGQTTEDGDQILFYVKALYDYAATIEEEFDFQAGDIIAVTSTPEDGWWTGELLDEVRRQPGRNVFPSNFVCLF